jgi:hypothetical protein
MLVLAALFLEISLSAEPAGTVSLSNHQLPP